MKKEVFYYPKNGTYWVATGSMYAQLIGDFPTPCRKYHISSDIKSAERISKAILPLVNNKNIFHKIVSNKSQLLEQLQSKQAGKFITLYLSLDAGISHGIIKSISKKLNSLKREYKISPSVNPPTLRSKNHQLTEKPIDTNRFIYGGFLTDPTH